MTEGQRLWDNRHEVVLSDDPMGLMQKSVAPAVQGALPSDMIILWCHDCLESWIMPIEVALAFPTLEAAQGHLAECAVDHDAEGICKRG